MAFLAASTGYLKSTKSDRRNSATRSSIVFEKSLRRIDVELINSDNARTQRLKEHSLCTFSPMLKSSKFKLREVPVLAPNAQYPEDALNTCLEENLARTCE